MGKRACLVREIVLVGWKATNTFFFKMEYGWLKRDFNYFGGPGVLVFLAEVTQGSVD